MEGIVSLSNTIMQPLFNLGAAPMMLIVLTVIALIFKVKFGKALEGGIKLAIALTAIGAVIGIFTHEFQDALNAFVASTGLNLSIVDVGWAPLATITWGSPYTLYFLFIMVVANIVMLGWNKTDTLDVDIFDIWHLAFVGLFAMWCGADIIIASILVLFIGVLKIINSDLMHPTFAWLLDSSPESNPMTSTHMNYMMNPIIMVFDKIFDALFPWVDKYDFDAASLNKKVGFWGSKFAIGIYLGIFIGLLGHQDTKQIFVLALTAAFCLELFSIIGSWFIEAIEPLSQGITNFANEKLGGRRINIGLDWPFIAGRAEIWAVANVLAPIMLLEALVLPGNMLLPLGGIIAMGVTPALLVVTRGKMIRMIVIGALELPLFLWAGTLTAPFVTETAKAVGAFPSGVSDSVLISHTTMEGPIEKFLGYLVGNGAAGNPTYIMYAIIALAAYLGIFIWYAFEMKKRNAEMAAAQN